MVDANATMAPTDGFREAVSLSREIAIEHDLDQIGTPELMLALLRTRSGRVYPIIDELGADVSELEKAVASYGGSDRAAEGEPLATPPAEFAGAIPLTETAESTIRTAFDLAARIGRGGVGTEHLLLAALRTAPDGAAKPFVDAGVTYEKVAARLEERDE